jgi:tRNA (guanine37-N1)-methyltransferase
MFHSIPMRAQKAGLVELAVHDLREWGVGKHRSVDDQPYGGGPGMVMACPPLVGAIRAVQSLAPEQPAHVVYLTPQGVPLKQARILELAEMARLLLVCGHYEGIDERVVEMVVHEEVCIGDFVVSGGELPAMMLAEAVIRVLPGAISADSVTQDSFYHGLLDHPHYTRPPEFEGHAVPDVLLSGDHKKIAAWRHCVALQRTRERRPDLKLE